VVTSVLDIAKSVFQLHGVDAAGASVPRQRLTRSRLLPLFEKLPRRLMGIAAWATSHHSVRQLIALGQDVKLMPAQYGRPYVKRGKNDAVEAEPICEAMTRSIMRVVAVKTRARTDRTSPEAMSGSIQGH
jgi:transposase